MDVQREAISIVALNSSGRLVVESIIETKSSTIIQLSRCSGTLGLTAASARG
jgi:hypothetical protein